MVSLSFVPLLAQTAAIKDLLDRIRKEEKDNSQIMRTVTGFAFESSIGPRQKTLYLLIDAKATKAAGVTDAVEVEVVIEPYAE
jgi:hypothetical protein